MGKDKMVDADSGGMLAYTASKDIRNLEQKVDNKFNSLEATLDTQFNKLNESYNGLRLEIQTLSGRINPIEHDMRNKVSTETYNALERRVSKMEDSPNGIRANIGLLVSSVGCMGGIIFSSIGLVVTILFFILQNYK